MNNSSASFHLPLFKARYFSVGPRSAAANPPRLMAFVALAKEALRLCGKNILTVERPKSLSPFPLSAFRIPLFTPVHLHVEALLSSSRVCEVRSDGGSPSRRLPRLPLAPFHICLIVGLLFLLPTLRANPPVLVAGDGTYLGVVSANEYDPESTSNPFGLYGSAFSATSINNPYSLYGSEFSADSANNPYVVSGPLEK